MIYNCTGNAYAVDATKWKKWDNGTIISPRSSLVLSATSGNMGIELTLQENVYATSQAWAVSNNTEAISGEMRQMFALYPDGSIRLNGNRDDCLTADHKSNMVAVALCNGGVEQRWSFNRDNTISNLNSGLVMEARNNYLYLYPSSLPRETSSITEEETAPRPKPKISEVETPTWKRKKSLRNRLIENSRCSSSSLLSALKFFSQPETKLQNLVSTTP
ncbi:hypothetical protein POM88_036682 [Heracleum sosnowskyi]|uniref:Ricin B lectin domain-containing protein n=1 Tax=Heracleum sosnowskyi TaxID=360622 RepID=A0AAD8MCL9_9APIA|nr:hypothetical protein POM88_036682 [Heracleum sosnowskyi]